MSSRAGWRFKYIAFIFVVCSWLCFVVSLRAGEGPNDANPSVPDLTESPQPANSADAIQSEIKELKRQLAEQQKQIEQLRVILQSRAESDGSGGATADTKTQPTKFTGSRVTGEVASVALILPSSVPSDLTAADLASESVPSKNEAPNATPTSALTAPARPASAPQVEESSLPKGIRGLEIGALWYLSYQNGSKAGSDYGQFTIKRGYINVVKKFTPWLETRITPDIYQDASGNTSVRIKYAYAKFIAPSMDFLYKPSVEFGVVHSPWLDFEENLNFYRLQDTMFEERNGNFVSADFGAMFAGFFGGEMSSDYKENVNSKYAGRYGSFALGIMNGGGYNAPEKNKNKVAEGRFTLRPIPDILPGLQFSYFGLIGQGNLAPALTTQPPDWRLNMGFISYESKYLTLTAQYLASTGNQSGTALNTNGTPARQNGYSFFCEFKVPAWKSSIIGRWDHYNPNTDLSTNVNNRYIVGYAYHLPMNSMLLLDVDRLKYRSQPLKNEWRFQSTIQVSYP
jgi:hypothetical protein